MIPIISIIIPSYNSSKTIVETLNSIYQSRQSNFEIIVVDDCSTDSSVEVVRNFEQKNKCKNLRLFKLNRNKGVSFARNYGIKLAKGKWIMFLDSDDSLNSNSLSKIIKNEKNSSYDLLAFGYIAKGEGFIKDYSSYKYNNRILKNQNLLKLFLSKKINLHISSIIFSREFLLNKRIKFDITQKVAEDLQFIILCLMNSENCFYDSYHLFNYQIFNSTAMNGYKYYSIEMAKSIEAFRDFTSNYLTGNNAKYFRYYLINFYVHNVYMLIKSQDYSKQAVRIVLSNISILKKKIPFLNWKRYIYLKSFQMLPISIYLKYCLWRK